jgi:hypothetical protein
MAISPSRPSDSSVERIAPGPSSRLNGLVRDEPRIVPPRGRIPRVDSTLSSSCAPSIGPRQPSLKPTISWPWSSIPRRTTARITAFRPGQSPPPVSTPIRTTGTIPARVRMPAVRRAPALICAAALLAGAYAGCGGSEEPARIKGDVATVYTSVPQHGVSVAAAEQVLAGERSELAARGGHAGGLRIRLRELAATDDRDHPWDPGLVAANAHRAADDPTAMAYLGEVDYGASAVSLPITNKAGLLQVSPGDGLTSLTTRPPGRPRVGPERYYPTDRRSFVRVGPEDLDEARVLVRLLEDRGATRFAVVFDREIYGRELAAQVTTLAREQGLTPVAAEEYRGRVDDIPGIARKLGDAHPDAVVHLCVAGRGTIPLLVAIGDRLPDVPMLASSGILALPELSLPPEPEEIEAVGPALGPRAAGRDAMRLVLDAIERGGRDRRRVIAAGLALGRRLSDDRVALYRPDDNGRLGRVAARFSSR